MANYYINSAVGGPGAGTIGDPWNEVSSHMGVFNAGDFVYFRGSTAPAAFQAYDEGKVDFDIDGADGNPITFMAFPTEQVEWTAGAEDIFAVTGTWLVFDGFHFDKEDNGSYGIDTRGSSDIVIQNCTIHNNDGGALIRVRGDRVTVDTCTLYDNDAGAADAPGIQVRECEGTIIRNCTIYDVTGDCVVILPDEEVGDVLVEKSTLYSTGAVSSENGVDCKEGHVTIRDCVMYGFRSKIPGTPTAPAITAHNLNRSLTVTGCEIYDCSSGIRALGRTSVTITKNLIYELRVDVGATAQEFLQIDSCTGVVIYNNTFDTDQGDAFDVSDSTIIFKNNITSNHGNIVDAGAAVTADYNCWWNGGDSWVGGNDVNDDPDYTDAANDDYTLIAGTSPCVDAGVDVGLPYEGAAPDMGYDETGASPPSNLVVIRDLDTTCFLFDGNGNAYATVAWNTFAEHDDIRLLNQLDVEFGEWAEEHRPELERLGLISGTMINMTKITELHVGAIQKLFARLAHYRNLANSL